MRNRTVAGRGVVDLSRVRLGVRNEILERLDRQRAVDQEQQWRIVDPVLQQPPPVRLYSRGTWGPEAASRLLNPGGSWYEPT